MKEYQWNCQVCGIIKMTPIWDTEDGTLMPVFAGTEKSFKKYLKHLTGEDVPEVRIIYAPLNHESPDDIGYEEAKKHYVGEFWCYTDM